MQPLEIDVSPAEGERFRHLIVTGPNGVGKSSLLKAMVHWLQNMNAHRANEIGLDQVIESWRQSRTLDSSKVTEQHDVFMIAMLANYPTVVVLDESYSDTHKAFVAGDLFVTFLPAQRHLSPDEVSGPRQLKLDRRRIDRDLSSHFVQYLVNRYTERAYAREEGDTAAVERISAWFERFTEQLRWLLEDDSAELVFDRMSFQFHIQQGDNRVDFGTLADGHSAVMAILAQLYLQVEACQQLVKDRSREPAGIVIIDEIETHLHLRLQEQILPFLTNLMPSVQFIVATHSPAVIASIPNAVVYDLGERTQTDSAVFAGVRYGSLMTEFFGLPSDMDIASTRELARARTLIAKSDRSEAEDSELRDIGARLSARSSSLALELFEAQEALEDSGD